MKTIQILFVAATALLLTSCNFDISWNGVDGNGNVVTKERIINQPFEVVRGTSGLDVFLTEGTENKVEIEADENLHDLIETEVNEGKLEITTRENIGRAKAKKIYVTYTNLSGVEASSGADVISNSVIKNETVRLKSSSGADLDVEVFAKDVYAESSSGADLKVSGKATKLMADASSGSDIHAKELLVIDCNAEASSGANITVNVKENLTTEASSGGDINYYGNPSAVSNDKSSAGSVRKM